MMFFVTVIF